MRLTNYFLPTLKENPAEAQIISHRLMLRAGMIKQSSAGIYSWLPLGFKVLRKIESIVHEEQQRAGHMPMLMPTIQVLTMQSMHVTLESPSVKEALHYLQHLLEIWHKLPLTDASF